MDLAVCGQEKLLKTASLYFRSIPLSYVETFHSSPFPDWPNSWFLGPVAFSSHDRTPALHILDDLTLQLSFLVDTHLP
jgi:hypothetical protein